MWETTYVGLHSFQCYGTELYTRVVTTAQFIRNKEDLFGSTVITYKEV